MTIKDIQCIDATNRSDLPPEEQALFELLDQYQEKSILPEKDQAAKLLLLRIRLNGQLLELLATQPDTSFKNAVLTLMNKLPDEFGDAELRVVVEVVSKKWPVMPLVSIADKVAGYFENQDT